MQFSDSSASNDKRAAAAGAGDAPCRLSTSALALVLIALAGGFCSSGGYFLNVLMILPVASEVYTMILRLPLS